MSWIDYKSAYSQPPHSRIREEKKNNKVGNQLSKVYWNTHIFFKIVHGSGQKVSKVSAKKIFQKDLLSFLFFYVALIVLTSPLKYSAQIVRF